jgi:hypothetical protein
VKTYQENITNPLPSPRKAKNGKSGPNRIAVRKKRKRDCPGWDSTSQMHTKNLGNSSIFPFITHTALSDKRFGSYRTLNIDYAAGICSGQNSIWLKTSLLGFGSQNSRSPEYQFGRQLS